MKNDKEVNDKIDRIVEIEKIRASTDKFYAVCDSIKHFVKIGGVVLSFYIIFKGLEPFLSSKPEVISAMGKIIEKINFSNITSYLVGSVGYTGWYLERKGKKRAIKQKGKYQKIAERNDEYRSSSGLTKSGDTPKGEIND